MAGHLHVHDIVVFEVYLSGAPGPSTDHHVVILSEGIVGILHGIKGLGFEADIGLHIHVPHRPPQDDDLRAGVAVRLQEDRVHPHVRSDPAGLGLDDLRPSHFPPSPVTKELSDMFWALKGAGL